MGGVLDTEEIVVALGRLFTQLTAFAGATIMVSGQVALISTWLVSLSGAGVLPTTQNGSEPSAAPSWRPPKTTRPLQRLLVMGVGNGRRMALPIELVYRIEGFFPGPSNTTAASNSCSAR